MGTDYSKPKLDTGAMHIPYPDNMRTRTCFRCSMPWYVHEMHNIGGGDNRWVCFLCFDQPYGEDQHLRGDFQI